MTHEEFMETARAALTRANDRDKAIEFVRGWGVNRLSEVKPEHWEFFLMGVQARFGLHRCAGWFRMRFRNDA